MNDAPIVNVVRPECCVATLVDDMQLVVWDHGNGRFAAQMFKGQWPAGDTLAGIVFDLVDAHIHPDDPKIDGIWLGHTKVYMPWLELLKVADYLQLPIPLRLPHPLPGDAQAAEASA